MIFKIFSTASGSATPTADRLDEETGTFADGYHVPECDLAGFRVQTPKSSAHERDYGHRRQAPSVLLGLA